MATIILQAIIGAIVFIVLLTLAVFVGGAFFLFIFSIIAALLIAWAIGTPIKITTNGKTAVYRWFKRVA